jgi:hypothetical protein
VKSRWSIGVWGLSDETRLRELSPQEILDRHPEFWDSVEDEVQDHGNRQLWRCLCFLACRCSFALSFLTAIEIEHDPDRTAVMGASMGGLDIAICDEQTPRNLRNSDLLLDPLAPWSVEHGQRAHRHAAQRWPTPHLDRQRDQGTRRALPTATPNGS